MDADGCAGAVGGGLMAVVTTSTVSTATAYSNQRKVDRCSNGVAWAMFWDGTGGSGTPMHFRYSTDGGGTWVDGGGFGFAGTGATYTPNGSFFIAYDQATGDERAVVVYKDRHDGHIYFRLGVPNAARTSWTWGAAVALWSATASADYPDVIAHREGTGWKAHAVFNYISAANTFTRYESVDIAADDTVVKASGGAYIGGGYPNTNNIHPSIDFNHTGDGKTVAGSTPHLYAAWSAGATGSGYGIRFKKATYSGGSWTWGTEREIDSTRHVSFGTRWLNCLFDGTRVIIPAFLDSSSGVDLMLYERDAGDTATTTRALKVTAAAADQIGSGSSSYDSIGNVYFVGYYYDGAFKIGRRKWDRDSLSLDAVVTVDATGTSTPYASAKRGAANDTFEFIYTDGSASPYSVTYGSVQLNRPPNAPIVTDQGTFNRANVNRVSWTFSDPDAGDSQSAAEVRYRENGTSTWTLVEVDNPNNFWDAPAGTFVADLYEAQVRTADQAGAWGPFSTSFFITAGDAPPGATILAPISGATIGTSSVTVGISAADVDEAEYRLYADDAGSIDLTTQLQPAVTKTTGVLRSHTWTGLTNGVPVWLWVRIKHDGLWSVATTQRNPVSYTPPPSPTLVTTPAPDTATIGVQITNPAPGTGEPAVSYNDLFVRSPAATPDADPYRPYPDGIRLATMQAPNALVTDELPAAGVEYEYLVRAHGENSTVSDSGWVSL